MSNGQACTADPEERQGGGCTFCRGVRTARAAPPAVPPCAHGGSRRSVRLAARQRTGRFAAPGDPVRASRPVHRPADARHPARCPCRGGLLAAGSWTWRDDRYARAVSILAGLGLLAFGATELVWVGFQPLEGVFALVGAAIVGIAALETRQ